MHTEQFPAEPHPSPKVYSFPITFICVLMCAHVYTHVYMEKIRGQIAGFQESQEYSDNWVGTGVFLY